MAVHAGLNKPSELFTATILTLRAGVRTVLFIAYTLVVPITQEKEIKIKNVSSTPHCVDNKDLIGDVGVWGWWRGVAVWQWWPYISFFSASVQTKLSGYRALRTVSRNSPILAPLKAL